MIEPDPRDTFLGLKAWEVFPKWLPEELKDDAGNVIKPGGMYVLFKLPKGALRPEPFVPGSYNLLQRIYYKVQLAWMGKDDNQKYIKDWSDFIDKAPHSDDVDEYLESNPEQFVIPFRHILFKGQ